MREARAATAASASVIGAARRAHLVNALKRAPDFDALTVLYKRAANLTKGLEVTREIDSALLREDAELRLYRELPALERAVYDLLERSGAAFPAWDVGSGPRGGDRSGLDAAVASVVAVKPALDEFFDRVLVMTGDETLRENRLTLLGRVRDAVRRVAHLELLA